MCWSWCWDADEAGVSEFSVSDHEIEAERVGDTTGGVCRTLSVGTSPCGSRPQSFKQETDNGLLCTLLSSSWLLLGREASREEARGKQAQDPAQIQDDQRL